MRIAVTCGGTGGHTYPGLATALELKERGHAVTIWVGSRGVESAALQEWSGECVRVAAGGLSGGIVGKAMGAVRCLLATVVSFYKLGRNRPEVMLAMGSYASVGPVLAARMRRIPVVLHEANAVPGRAITFLARFATGVAVTFPSTQAQFLKCNTRVTGLPLRPGFNRATQAASASPLTVLVMGGSQGARVLNEAIPGILGRLVTAGLELCVIHLAGKGNAKDVSDRYTALGVRAEVHDYLHDMAGVYARTSVAIARAGAGACMELACCAIPAIFIPLPQAIRDHQSANARALVDCGGALVVEQSRLTDETLERYIDALAREPSRLVAMRTALSRWAVCDGASRLADFVDAVAEGNLTTTVHQA